MSRPVRLGLLFAVLLLGGCEESPTSVVMEQRVFNLLGDLRVGQSLVLSGAEAQRVLLGGRPSAQTHIYIPFHSSRAEGRLELQVTGENVVGSGLTPSVGLRSAGGVLDASRVDSRRRASWEMHQQLHERLTAEAAAYLATPRLRASLPANAPSVRTSLSGNNAFVGQLVDINASTANFCQGIDLRQGRVEAISQRAIVVGDINNPSGGYTRADYEGFAQLFDSLIHPTVVQYFSEPTDIDSNNRVIVFFTRAVNELTSDPSDGFISGFFWVRDLFPRTAPCAASNEGEIFFLLAPDPNGEASPLRHTREEVSFDAGGVIGHEFQHLINAGRRLYVNNASELEEAWLDEGLSHAAEEFLFYAATGLQPGSNIAYESLTTQTVVNAINRYMVQNLVRFGLYLEEVQEQSPISGDDDLETRGAAWSLLRYASDHSSRSDQEFFRLLVNGPATGMTNLGNVVGEDPLEIVRRWGVANYTDDFVNGVEGVYRHPSWNYRSLLPRLFTIHPLDVLTLAAGPASLSISAGSSAYVLVGGMPGEVTRVMATSGGADPPASLKVTVVRVN